MSESESQVFFFDNEDPQMQHAFVQARETFGFFWRELAWEMRRIVPALELACVKAPFFDETSGEEGQPEAEQMWISDVNFDGNIITGTLINSPNWVKSVEEGDTVQVPRNEISDWMYAINGRVFGAFTVNLMRKGMPPEEMAQHDEAWGMQFGDPNQIELVPEWEPGTTPELEADHPMAINMKESLETYLSEDPSHVNQTDEEGWSLLHHQALAGSHCCVSALLRHGADVNATTKQGLSPLQLANSLGWKKVAQLLTENGGR